MTLPSLQAKQLFIDWVKHYEPGLYKVAVKSQALKRGEPAIYGMSAIEEEHYESMAGIADMFKSIGDSLIKVAPAVIQYKTQSKILNTQLKRAEMGLPPMQVEDYAPVIRVSPEFDPESEAALTRMATQTAGSTLQRYGLPIFIGVAGLLIVFKLMRR